MLRLALLALALPLAACADPPADPEPPADAPMTFEDSAAAVRAQIDSLGALIEGDQRRIEAGFAELDSLRDRIDETEAGLDALDERLGQ